MAKALHIALGLALLGGAAQAQGFDSLPEDQQIGYCAGFYLAEGAHLGADQPLAAGFVALAARTSGQAEADVAAKLEGTTPMLVPFFQTYDSNPSAQAMIDQSRAFCEGLAAGYDETAGLLP